MVVYVVNCLKNSSKITDTEIRIALKIVLARNVVIKPSSTRQMMCCEYDHIEKITTRKICWKLPLYSGNSTWFRRDTLVTRLIPVILLLAWLPSHRYWIRVRKGTQPQRSTWRWALLKSVLAPPPWVWAAVLEYSGQDPRSSGIAARIKRERNQSLFDCKIRSLINRIVHQLWMTTRQIVRYPPYSHRVHYFAPELQAFGHWGD